ncbi:MAG TPA: methyltransferase domain-containing protein [Stellaceae bacterium]|nr:methyltransferase domain-containing protein [Stellaceae bacterium]
MLRESPAAPHVEPVLADYARLASDAAAKRARYTALVNEFYDLVTDFYEYGWGQSFNFATRFRGETMREAIARGEHGLALRLGLRPGMRVLDVGCGIGGPMRSIARFSGAEIVGINNNDYQLDRAETHTRATNLEGLCSARKGDFMAMPFAPDSFDAAYAIAATCHAPSLEGVYAEVLRMLKPGGRFACVEWCTTERFNPAEPSHQRLREAVAAGNGLVAVCGTDEALAAARSAGFDIVEATDLALVGDIPWYEPLASRGFNLASFRASKFGRWCINQALGVFEPLRVAPRGSRAVHTFLCEAADTLVAAGEAAIFTPLFLMIMQKPSP